MVSVPLSISFAIASGASPVIGLTTSAVAGIFAASLGGSHFNVISPASAFVGILTGVVALYGPGAIPVVTVLAGLIMFAAYLLKLERFLALIPGSVMTGFTLGVAFIIAGSQLGNALGLELHHAESVFLKAGDAVSHLGLASPTAVITSASVLGVLMLMKWLMPKVPGIIIVTPIGLLLGYAATNLGSLDLVTIGSQYGSLSSQLINFPTLFFDTGLIIPALTIALVGILETMVSAKIADGLTKTHHHRRKEMFGQAISNIASGLAGGMPATGVFAPTALNIKSGATHRTSAIIKGVLVAVITLLFFHWFQYLPMAVIAGILIFVAIRLIEVKHLKMYWKHDKAGLLIVAIVAFLTAHKDPALGIAIGTALGLMMTIEQLTHGTYELGYNTKQKGEVDHVYGEKHFNCKEEAILVYSFKGLLSHLNGQSHFAHFESLEKGKRESVIIFRFREVSFIDIDGVNTLDEIIDEVKKHGFQVALTSLPENVLRALEQHCENYHDLKQAGLIFGKTRYALKHFGIPLRKEDQ